MVATQKGFDGAEDFETIAAALRAFSRTFRVSSSVTKAA